MTEATQIPEPTIAATTEEVVPVVNETPETPSIDIEATTETLPIEEAKTVSQEDFNKVYFQMKQNERELTALKTSTPAVPDTPPDIQSPPKLEDYDFDDDAFTKASIQYQVKVALATQVSDTKKADAHTASQAITDTFNNRAVEYAASNPEYEKAIAAAGNLLFAPHIQEVLLTSEVGPQLDYMLLTNPQLATKLNTMSATAAIMEMGRMEQTITKPVVQPPVNVSDAPPPIDVVDGSAGGGGDFRYDDDLSMDEYYKKHMAEATP